jgi:hypothetical protein
MRVTRISATGGLLLALAAGLAVGLWPCASQGVETSSGAAGERRFCASLVEADGAGVLAVLAVPVLLAGVGLLAVRRRRRGLLLAATAALVGFCLLALASVGLFFLPAAAALVVAAAGWRRPPAG